MNAVLRFMLFFGAFYNSNFSCAMDSKSIAVDPFPFHQLSPRGFAHFHNKTTLAGLNKQCSQLFSIKNENIFSHDFCDVMYAKKHGLDRMCAILFCAAYKGNLKGVENILKNSGILHHYRYDGRDYGPTFYAQSSGQLRACKIQISLDGIARDAGNHRLESLLRKYNVQLSASYTTPKMENMACIEGDSDKIIQLFSAFPVRHEFDKMINLLIDLDYEKCLLRVLAHKWPKGLLKIEERHKKKAILGHNNHIVVDALSLCISPKKSKVLRLRNSAPLVDKSQRLPYCNILNHRGNTLLNYKSGLKTQK